MLIPIKTEPSPPSTCFSFFLEITTYFRRFLDNHKTSATLAELPIESRIT